MAGPIQGAGSITPQPLQQPLQPPVQAPADPNKYGKVIKMNELKAREWVQDKQMKIKEGISAFQAQKDEMREFDRYWLGKHWDDDTTAAPWMPRPVENWVFATVEQHSANLSTANIQPIITGQDPGDEDVAALFDLVLQYLAQPNKLNLRRITRRSIHTALKLGTAIVKVYWDNNYNYVGKDLSMAPKTMVSPIDQSSFTVVGTSYKGEICLEMVDPSNIIPDPTGWTLDGGGMCEWINIRTPRKREWVQNNKMFAGYMGKQKLADAMVLITSQQGKSQTEFYIDRPSNRNHFSTQEVNLDEFWYRTMDDYGNWKINLAYMVGDALLFNAEEVYKDGQYPFSILYDVEIDKNFFGMGEPKQVIPNNHAINQLNRLAAHSAMLMTNTQKEVLVDSGLDIDMVAQTGSMPNAVFPSRVANGIRNIEVSEIPHAYFKVAEDARNGIRNIMSMDEANMGQFGGSVTAASGIQMIQNKASVRDQDKGISVEDFVARILFLMCSRMQQFYDTERYVPIVDKTRLPALNGGNSFFPFTGTEYKDTNLAIRIEAGSGTPMNKASIYQRAWEMFQKQCEQKFSPPLITVEELLKCMDAFPIKEDIISRIKNATAQDQASFAMQMAGAFKMLQMSGVDPTVLNQSQMASLVQQVQQGMLPGATPPNPGMPNLNPGAGSPVPAPGNAPQQSVP